MATIDISSVVSYYNSGTRSTSGTASSTASSESAAKTQAKNAASNAANSVGGGTPASGGSSSTTDLKFGSNYGSVSGGAGSPGATYDPVNKVYEGFCSYSSSRTSTMYQLKLKFTIPNGLTAANIESATISFTAKAGDTNEQTYYLCAPKTTSEQTTYQKYSETTIIDTSKFISFKAPGNTNVKTYTSNDFTNDFTDVFKQCITNGQGWVTILLPRDTPEATRTMTLSGTPQITYTENYSACGAPTSVSCGTAIQKPGATVSISWSGATAGTNNAIVGYRVYWKSGGAPTISSYTNYADVTSSPYSFTVPNDRGTTYYFKVLTRGTVSGYNSGLSSAQATTKVNSLPAVPSVTVNKARIKSTGEAVTFTVTAGSDSDSGQTLSVWYNTDGTSWSGSNCKQVPSNGQLTTGTLTATTTYYFRTWDGLEYSSSYTSQSIIKNTPPTISSITMSAYNNTTYSPSKDNRSYVKNINGSASGVTGTSLSYQWYLCVGSGTDATSFGTVTNISTATSISNIDVTSYGANFNTAYKIALTVTDDLGESVTAWSPDSTVYVIPAAPSITVINNKSNTNWGSEHNVNPSHFDNGMRFTYNENNTGLTRELQYSTTSSFSSYSTISLNGIEYSDVDLTALARGTTYYFRVKYTCNTKTTTSAITSGYMRANDITPTNLTITPVSGTQVKPYTQSTFSFSFGGQPISWATTNDVAISYSDIYIVNLWWGGKYLTIGSTGSNSGGTITGTGILNTITNTQWKTLLGNSSSAPNTTYVIALQVIAVNGFGSIFAADKNFTVNFAEGIYSIGTPELRIKTGSTTYTKIPDNYNNKTQDARYHIFEGQILQLSLTGLQCYANQAATIYFMLGNTNLGTTIITANEWIETNVSGTSFRYTLNVEKTIDYIVPQNTESDYSLNERNYSVKVVLDNGQQATSDGGNLKTCFHMRFAPSTINFKITGISNNELSQTWSCTQWGGLDGSVRGSIGFSGIYVRVQYSTSPNGTYTPLGSGYTALKRIPDMPGAPAATGSISNDLSSISGDILYFGSIVYLILDFQYLDENNTILPIGTREYAYIYTNQYAYYRATPNLLYGKNFFALNQNQPITGRTKQLLEISTAQYTSGNSVVTRDTIYFGTDGTNFQITGNGLEIDCGSW